MFDNEHEYYFLKKKKKNEKLMKFVHYVFKSYKHLK